MVECSIACLSIDLVDGFLDFPKRFSFGCTGSERFSIGSNARMLDNRALVMNVHLNVVSRWFIIVISA